MPLFNAVELNGSEAMSSYRMVVGVLPSGRVRAAFANQLADVIRNQDLHCPLFSNYSGRANGWYAWPTSQGMVLVGLVALLLGWHQPSQRVASLHGPLYSPCIRGIG